MDRKRCPHVSGDPNQRTHTLPCRDVICFTCLNEIPELLKGGVFSCPLCGGYSQYVDPKRAILGAETGNKTVANTDSVGTNGHSLEEADSYLSTTEGKINEERGYNTGQHFGSSTPIYEADGCHAKASDHVHERPIGNSYEVERQRKLLQNYAKKKYSQEWDEGSEQNVHQPTQCSSDLHSELHKNPHFRHDLYRDHGLNRESDRPRRDFNESGSIREDNSPQMVDHTGQSGALNAHPSDYSSVPDEVVGNISADELHKQDELMNKFKQQHETTNEVEKHSSGRVQTLYDNAPYKGQAVGSMIAEDRTVHDHDKDKRLSCESHNSKAFSMYCPTCNTMLCKECLETDPYKHRYHTKDPVSVKVMKQRLVNSFEKYNRNLAYVRGTLDTELKRMEGDTAEIFRKAEEMKKKIDTETENACKKLKENAKAMTEQVDEKLKQLFDSRQSHSAKVNDVQKKLENATAVVCRATDAIEANNIPLAMGAEESVLSFIDSLKGLKLQPPKDSFDLEFHSREIPDSSSTSAPIYLSKMRWNYSYAAAGPVYFYVGSLI